MAFPDDILTPAEREDGGVAVTGESKVISAVVTNAVVLDHYARGKEVLSNGRVLSSTITVSQGGVVFTEVFDTPVPATNTFYHYEDTTIGVNSSVLLFNSAHAGETVTISYETRGDYVLAAAHNRIESDLEAIETAFGVGFMGMQGGSVTNSGAGVADVTITVDTDILADPTAADIFVQLTSELGKGPYAFAVAADHATIVVSNVDAGDVVHYLLTFTAV